MDYFFDTYKKSLRKSIEDAVQEHKGQVYTLRGNKTTEILISFSKFVNEIVETSIEHVKEIDPTLELRIEDTEIESEGICITLSSSNDYLREEYDKEESRRRRPCYFCGKNYCWCWYQSENQPISILLDAIYEMKMLRKSIKENLEVIG